MKIIEKIIEKQNDLIKNKSVTIAFLGDSVTQGCFECYLTSETSLETVFDYKSAYSTRLKEILNILYPSVQINVINAGVSGDGTTDGKDRLYRDVIDFKPDLCVVSYGLNDACLCDIEDYKKNLNYIFDELNKNNIESIFLTQNTMCTKTSCHLTDKLFRNLSVDFAKVQNDGKLKKYMTEASIIAEKHGAKVCNVHLAWEKMIENKVDVTELLANKLNHPIREFHYYTAIKLLETIFEI